MKNTRQCCLCLIATFWLSFGSTSVSKSSTRLVFLSLLHIFCCFYRLESGVFSVWVQQLKASVVMKGRGEFWSGVVDGRIKLIQNDCDSPVVFKGVIFGLTPGRHGIHVHTYPITGDSSESTGHHFDPFMVKRISLLNLRKISRRFFHIYFIN